MTPKHKIILLIMVLLITFICNVAVRMFVIDGQISRIMTLQKVVSAADKDSSLTSAKTDTGGAWEEEDDIKLILSNIPGEVQVSEYTSQIGKLVEKNHLAIEGALVLRSEKSEREDLVKYNTEINVFGGYPGIKQFVADLQNLPGMTYLSSAVFSRPHEGAEEIKFKAGFTVFFKKGDYET